MGLVDSKCGQEATSVELLENGGKRRGGEPLRGDIEDLDMRLGERCEFSKGLINGGGVLGGAEVACFYPSGLQGSNLVLHQGDEGAYNNGNTVGKEGRELVAERLAPARGEEDQTGAAVEDVGNDVHLHFPELVQAKCGPQHLEHLRFHGRRCGPGRRRWSWFERMCHLFNTVKGLCRVEEAR